MSPCRIRWEIRRYLDGLGHWLGRQGITGLLDPQSPAKLLLHTFDAVRSRIPKRVFVARWYPPRDSPAGAHHKAELRVQQLHRTLEDIQQRHNIELELVDMGTVQGATFPIHSEMYEAIESSDIIVCDLTGHRPNVYVEAGFALSHHDKGRLVFLFEPADEDDSVPFDLATFKYVSIGQAAEIPAKLGAEIEAILAASGAALHG